MGKGRLLSNFITSIYGSNIREREKIACAETTSAILLKRLAKDSFTAVQYWVALNHNSPTSALNNLNMSLPNVRRALARNPNTSHAMLSDISSTTDFRIYMSVAQNPNTPLTILLDIYDMIIAAEREENSIYPAVSEEIIREKAIVAEKIIIKMRKKLAERELS